MDVSSLVDELGIDGAWGKIGSHGRDPGRFERGLQRLLDGIEAGLAPSVPRRR